MPALSLMRPTFRFSIRFVLGGGFTKGGRESRGRERVGDGLLEVEVLFGEVWLWWGESTLPYQKIQKFPWRAKKEKNRYVPFAGGRPPALDGGTFSLSARTVTVSIRFFAGRGFEVCPHHDFVWWLRHGFSTRLSFLKLLDTEDNNHYNGFRTRIRSPRRPYRCLEYPYTSQEALAVRPWLATCTSK